MIPVYVVDEIGTVINAVSAQLLAELKAYDSRIEAVNYLYGHPLEIIETLKQRDESDGFRFKKYPLVALFQDFPEQHGEIGIDSEVTLHLVIARATQPDYKASERYTENFKPVLYPIYFEFLRQLTLSGRFMTYGTSRISHTKIDRVFWGRAFEGDANPFNDWLDCIEIKDLKLKINLKNC